MTPEERNLLEMTFAAAVVIIERDIAAKAPSKRVGGDWIKEAIDEIRKHRARALNAAKSP